jgi:predicted ArsR family transcriptional regulator
VFFTTERGEEQSGRTYLQLLSRMFRHLERTESPQSGGPAALDLVFAGIAAEVAAEHESEVRGSTLAERVAEASRALEPEGIVDEWLEDEGAFRMINAECPYLRLAAMSDAACRSDRRSIELLVGAEVEQTSRIVDGAPVCEYIIRQALPKPTPPSAQV